MPSKNGRGPISAEAMFAVDMQQHVVAWNQPAARSFGYDSNCAVGRHCYEIVGAFDTDGRPFCRPSCPVIRAAGHSSALPPLRLQGMARNGTLWPFEVSTIVLQSDDQRGLVIHLCRPTAPGDLAPVAPATPHARLTGREHEVLACLCRGHGTDVIAAELGITEATVRNHVQRLLDKLSAHSRAELVALAYQEHLLDT